MPVRQKILFPNGRGIQLAASLEVPDRAPRAWVLFAHCFTCGKDSSAASRIARTLASRDFAVLRFDFTGLGGSEGDFANSDFSSNLEDLVAAAAYLREHHAAPALLIGHSLGGTAVLAAAAHLPEVKAVVTIGAPSSPEHVVRQFGSSVQAIERSGEAEVNLAGRVFRISRRFLDDVREQAVLEEVGRLRRALLILHAPLDDVVSVDEAGRIFQAAKHPKSFVSLDGADHLLSSLADAQYVANTVAAWVERYLQPLPAAGKTPVAGGEVVVAEGNRKFLRDVSSDDHHWLADEPKRVGGDNLGPDPYEHLLAALGTCTSMTIRMFANRKGWPLDHVLVRLAHDREYDRDCEGCDERPAQLDVIDRLITLEGELSEAQRARLMDVADRCPVHRTLEGRLQIRTRAQDASFNAQS